MALAMSAVALGGAAVTNAEPYASCKAAAQDGVYDIPSDSSDYGLGWTVIRTASAARADR